MKLINWIDTKSLFAEFKKQTPPSVFAFPEPYYQTSINNGTIKSISKDQHIKHINIFHYFK